MLVGFAAGAQECVGDVGDGKQGDADVVGRAQARALLSWLANVSPGPRQDSSTSLVLTAVASAAASKARMIQARVLTAAIAPNAMFLFAGGARKNNRMIT